MIQLAPAILSWAMLGGFLAVPVTLFGPSRLEWKRSAHVRPCPHESLNIQMKTLRTPEETSLVGIRLRCWTCGWTFAAGELAHESERRDA